MKHGAGLALAALAWLSLGQVRIWSSDLALWSDVHRLRPESPRAAINLAVEAIAVGDWPAAVRWLDEAEPLARVQAPFDRAWSLDALEANRAVVDIHAGRLEVARLRLEGAPYGSIRWAVCRQFFREVCR